MKNREEIGLKHLQEMGISLKRRFRDIFALLCSIYGEKEANEYMAALWKETSSTPELYVTKDLDHEKAVIFSGAYDADIIRKTCDWIHEHRDLFGKEILEVGCDCGFITCFLAKEFPDSKIVSIDRNPAAIEITRKNLEKFNYTNVKLLNIDVKDLSEKSFDTVCSIRIAQENRKNKIIESIYDDWRKASDEFVDVIEDYVKTIGKLIKPQGTLISIERMEIDPLMLGYLKALNKENIFFNTEDITTMKVKEPGQDDYVISNFTLIAGKKDIAPINLDLERKWIDLLKYNPYKSRWIGWEALVAIEDKADEMVAGYYMFSEGEKAGKFAYYTVKNKTDKAYYLYLMYFGEGENCGLVLLPKGEEPKIKESIEAIIEDYKSRECEAKRI